jgi:tRNA A-37 threonylcarbamoyl transferase component Bud32
VNTEDLLLQLFARWEEARAQGRRLSAVDLCGPNSDLIEPLQLKIEAAEATQVPQATERVQRTVALTGRTPAAGNTEPFETRPIDRRMMEAGSNPVEQPRTDTEPYDGELRSSSSPDDLDPRESKLHLGTDVAHLQYVAKGGLGIVYRGADMQLNRNVAVKFIQKRFAEDAEHCARMIREAEITGQLDHPGIVAVHGMGRSATGRLFYVMRYIKGTSLRDRIDRFYKDEQKADEREFEFRALLKSFVATCETIAYAHNCGILHRDIKPDNIMIGRFGETMVVDWGLAIPIDRALKPAGSVEQTLIPNSSSSTSDSGGGTLPYMSPEQAFGSTLLRPASDVYGLGATLYHLLAGKTAFEGNRFEVMERVRLGKFAPPRQVRPSVPAGLNAICLKAMSQDPTERYPLASDLAQDVERWLADLPVVALQDTVFQTAMRWGRRHRAAMRAIVAGLILFSVVVTTAAMFAVGKKREAEAAQYDTLITTAEFYKKTLQKDIQLRWSVLENAAKDPELIALLEKQNAAITAGDLAETSPLLTDLNNVLKKHFDANQATVTSSVWSLLSADGRQIALRSTELDRSSPMKPFAHRDYFHGQGENLPEGTSAPPLKRPHVSCVFVSSTRDWMVTAFSVPVFATARIDATKPDSTAKPIGVLSMVIDSHHLTDSILGKQRGSRTAMMVELRDYSVASKAGTIRSEGLLIQHPRLTEKLVGIREGSDTLLHIDSATLRKMRDEPAGLIKFADPIDGGGERTAAYAQVSVADLGVVDQPKQRWAVIIRE